MIDEKNILEYVKNKGIQSSLEEISSLIKSQDRESIKKSQEKRFRYEIWDKKMAINGISAKDVIKSREYTIDKAYLIYIDENIVYFQDHNPNESGYVKMNKTQATKIAEDFINKKIEENVDNIIIEKVINEILSK
jgi:hypothetical protein